MSTILLDKASELSVSIAPDWPMITLTAIVGLTSFMTSRALIQVTKQNQEALGKHKQAEMRAEWQRNFRDLFSKFDALCVITNATHHTAKEYNDYIAQLYSLKTSITLLLPEDKDASKILSSLMMDLVAGVICTPNKAKIDTEVLTQYLNEAEKCAREILESTWQEIKRDLT